MPAAHAASPRRRAGQIAVLDRPRLEQRVCECYGVVKRESDRLLKYDDVQDRRMRPGEPKP
jgi:hypothetical protein